MALTIVRCDKDDIEDVVRFIDEHWKRGHALVVNRRLLDWQYRNTDGSYSFVIARRDGDVIGMIGYIATCRFDPALAADNVLWLTTWKVRDDAGVAGLGLSLLRQVAAQAPHVAIGALGFNPSTRPIYEGLGYTVGELQHYVMPNVAVSEFALASFAAPYTGPAPVAPLALRPLSHDEVLDVSIEDRGWPSPPVPRKTVRYFHARYACHPIYSYRVLAIEEQRAVVGLLAVRTAEHGGARALRIVDLAGAPDAFARIGAAVQALVQAERAEYADVYNAGIDADAFARGGFVRIASDGADVVPDHFEPFERRNVRLWYAVKGAGASVLFKGDADQDRPGLVAPDR